MSAEPATDNAEAPSTQFQENQEREIAIAEYKQKVTRHRYVLTRSLVISALGLGRTGVYSAIAPWLYV